MLIAPDQLSGIPIHSVEMPIWVTIIPLFSADKETSIGKIYFWCRMYAGVFTPTPHNVSAFNVMTPDPTTIIRNKHRIVCDHWRAFSGMSFVFIQSKPPPEWLIDEVGVLPPHQWRLRVVGITT